MRKILPIGLAIFAILGWLVFLTIREQPQSVNLSPLASGQMAAFEIFDEPRDLPPALFFDREGNQGSFKDFLGRVSLINIWATWCEPCKEEMPTLASLQEQIGSENFQVITVSVDWQGYKVIDEFLKEYKIANLPAYWDNSGLLPARLDVIGLPLTILVDAKGQWIGRMDGPADWDSADAIALMKAASKTPN